MVNLSYMVFTKSYSVSSNSNLQGFQAAFFLDPKTEKTAYVEVLLYIQLFDLKQP